MAGVQYSLFVLNLLTYYNTLLKLRIQLEGNMRSVPSAVSRGLGVLLFFATNVILATESLYGDKQTSSTELMELEFCILLLTDINTTFLFISFAINPTFMPS